MEDRADQGRRQTRRWQAADSGSMRGCADRLDVAIIEQVLRLDEIAEGDADTMFAAMAQVALNADVGGVDPQIEFGGQPEGHRQFKQRAAVRHIADAAGKALQTRRHDPGMQHVASFAELAAVLAVEVNGCVGTVHGHGKTLYAIKPGS